MGISTATIEMRAPEEIRERLHELVKATRTVIVLSCTPEDRSGDQDQDRDGDQDQDQDQIDGRPMALVKTGDDTTMYLAAALDARQAAELDRARVTVVVQGAEYALFSGEARVSRDRTLIDELWTSAWRQWCRDKRDPAIAIVTVTPLEGSYWEDANRHSYVFRLA